MLSRTANAPDAPVAALGFHAQQAVEKFLKAVLSASSVHYPRTHDITVLLDIIEENGLAAASGCKHTAKINSIRRSIPLRRTHRPLWD